MGLKEYFESTEGTGILSTADGEGRVNAAVYARPHVMEDGTVAFIMAERLTLENLKTNPHAAYLFVEEGQGYWGRRLYLTKLREDQDPELIRTLRRRSYPPQEEAKVGKLHLVYFRLDEERPLLGAGPSV